MKILYKPIGYIHSPYTALEDIPSQPTGEGGIRCTAEILPEYQAGLQDLNEFSHLILIYHLHKIEGYKLSLIPSGDTQLRGLFATRSPQRPNPIGVSVVRLYSIHSNILELQGLDALDGTPLLDIKPYIPALIPTKDVRTGWLEHKHIK